MEANNLYFSIRNKLQAEIKAWEVLGFKDKAEAATDQLAALELLYNLFKESYDTISAAYIQRCNSF